MTHVMAVERVVQLAIRARRCRSCESQALRRSAAWRGVRPIPTSLSSICFRNLSGRVWIRASSKRLPAVRPSAETGRRAFRDCPCLRPALARVLHRTASATCITPRSFRRRNPNASARRSSEGYPRGWLNAAGVLLSKRLRGARKRRAPVCRRRRQTLVRLSRTFLQREPKGVKVLASHSRKSGLPLRSSGVPRHPTQRDT